MLTYFNVNIVDDCYKNKSHKTCFSYVNTKVEKKKNYTGIKFVKRKKKDRRKLTQQKTIWNDTYHVWCMNEIKRRKNCQEKLPEEK